MDRWKEFARKAPTAYLYSCWILIGILGGLSGIGAGMTALLILVVGYFFNVIWMLRR